MACERETKSLESINDFSTTELYCHSQKNQDNLLVYIDDNSLVKHMSDYCDFDKQKQSTFQEYFQNQYPMMNFRKDQHLITMRNFRRPPINFLNQQITDGTKEKANIQPIHIPLELVGFAPLNQQELRSIYRLPSLLVRICQLYRIELLRERLSKSLKLYSVSE